MSQAPDDAEQQAATSGEVPAEAPAEASADNDNVPAAPTFRETIAQLLHQLDNGAMPIIFDRLDRDRQARQLDAAHEADRERKRFIMDHMMAMIRAIADRIDDGYVPLGKLSEHPELKDAVLYYQEYVTPFKYDDYHWEFYSFVSTFLGTCMGSLEVEIPQYLQTNGVSSSTSTSTSPD